MAKAKVNNSTNSRRKIRPALTPEARENQMISLAMDVVEQRLLDGTASSQETTHFLKLGTIKAQLEKEKLERENQLLEAKTEQYKSMKKSEELMAEALKAFRDYSGQGVKDNDEEEDY